MSKTWRVALILLLTIIVSVLISACQGKTASFSSSTSFKTTTSVSPTTTSSVGSNPGAFDCVSGSIIASGSTTLQPYVEAVATSYTAKCPSASITVQPNDSLTGLNDVWYNVSQIGDSDVPALDTQSDLVDHQVAIAIFAMVVNPAVTVRTIKSRDLAGIYSGKITNWQQLGGANMPITIISRPTTSGTRATFKRFMLAGQGEQPDQTRNFTVDSTDTLIQTVAQTRGAIGYASLASATGAGAHVSIMKIDNKAPSLTTVQTNSYKFWSIEHMYTKGQASGLALAFLNYMLSNDAISIAKRLKFVEIHDVPQSVINTHQ